MISSSPSHRQDLPDSKHGPPQLAMLAARHGFSEAAARTFWNALTAGRGGMAQFDHPEFGGPGQWMRGGMLMVGDMFNHALAARVRALADDLGTLYDDMPMEAKEQAAGATADAYRWWPEGLRNPSTLGAQNGVRYAYFPAEGRLAIERGGELELYDTGEHSISGVSQQQGGNSTLAFSSQRGPVELSALRRIGARDESPAPAGRDSTAGPSSNAGEILDIIEKLSILCEQGVLSKEEFSAKKAQLLDRL
jgi:hypothetical protein